MGMSENKVLYKKQGRRELTERLHTTQEQIDEMRREIQREKQKAAGISAAGGGRKRSHQKKRRRIKLVGQVAFFSMVILLSAAIISIQITRSKGGIPSLLGFQMFVVESGSMEPTLNVGTVILSRKPEHAENLGENDIVTFRSLAGAVITHRIVEVVTGGDGNVAFHTKGDNPRNSVDQELLTPDRVLGRFVLKVPLT